MSLAARRHAIVDGAARRGETPVPAPKARASTGESGAAGRHAADDVDVTEPAGAARTHNLLGQRLGRKGRDTRVRLIAAFDRLLSAAPGAQPSMTAIAREAGVGEASIYRYFSDVGDLLLAALEAVAAEADAIVERHCHRWEDGSLFDEAVTYLSAHYRFWAEHARILHFRNTLADAGDARLLSQRRDMSNPAMECLARQLDGIGDGRTQTYADYAVVLQTMIERTATITTDATLGFAPVTLDGGDASGFVPRVLRAEASILAATIERLRGDRAAA